jgi:hypothetical protein
MAEALVVEKGKTKEEYIIRGPIAAKDLTAQYLARIPRTEELFLLLGGPGSYSVFKGNKKDGLREGIVMEAKRFRDCYAIKFAIGSEWCIITNPHSIGLPPSCDDLEGHIIELELVKFRIV